MEPIPAEPIPAEPPPPADASPATPVSGPRPGQLTARWSSYFWIGWLLVVGSLVAVWYSSRTTGLSTWWLGAPAEPRLILVNLFPFSVPLALCLGGLSGARRLPWYGIGGAVFLAVIAAFDIRRVPGYAAIEFLCAGAGLLISLASFAGMFRNGPPTDEPLAPPAAGEPLTRTP